MAQLIGARLPLSIGAFSRTLPCGCARVGSTFAGLLLPHVACTGLAFTSVAITGTPPALSALIRLAGALLVFAQLASAGLSRSRSARARTPCA